MARSYRAVNRDQPFLLPPDMREWLPGDHLVWFLLEVLERVDRSVFHAGHPNRGAGRAAYDPDMLLALLIYAYCCGERSSRQIERLCQLNVAFRVVCAGDIPDHTTIARFRAEHQDAFESVFAQVLAIAGRAGLAKFETVAIDGTKIAANASLDANRDKDWFLRQEVARIVAEAEAADQVEDTLHGPDDDATPPRITNPCGRAARIAAAAAQLEAEQKARAVQELARAQDEARRLRPRRQQRVAEAQARLEARIAIQQAKLDRRAARIAAGQRVAGVVPVPVEDHVTVRRARIGLRAAQKRLEAVPVRAQGRHKQPKRSELVANLSDPQSRTLPTRKGWVQGYNAQLAITADQVIVALSLGQNPVDAEQFIPMMRATQHAAAALHALTDNPQHEIGTLLADAGYPSEDNFAAQGPDRLIALGKSRDQNRTARTHPAQGEPPENATAREIMDHRLRTPEGAALYKRRGATVEPGIGNLKKLLNRFSRRGLDAARSELHIAATAFNLRKIHTAALS